LPEYEFSVWQALGVNGAANPGMKDVAEGEEPEIANRDGPPLDVLWMSSEGPAAMKSTCAD
jgi:hypothetical protein